MCNIDRATLDCVVGSTLSYIDPDVFYNKWDMFKDSLLPHSKKCFYFENEGYINALLVGVNEKPIFYDGTLNPINPNDAQAYLLMKDNIAYVFFRGTSGVADMSANLDCMQTTIKGVARVHTGFYKQTMSIYDAIKKDIDIYKPSKVVLCGHSLGGAIATITSLLFASDGLDVSCVTIGSPMVGNREFVSMFKCLVANSIRITNEYDPVPLLPYMWGYYHVHGMMHGKWKYCHYKTKHKLANEIDRFMQYEKIHTQSFTQSICHEPFIDNAKSH